MERVFVSAGEPSGDAHAAAVVEELVAAGVEVEGIGGDAMERAGTRLIGHIESMSAIGFVEVMGSIPRHVRLLRDAGRRLGARRPDAVLLVDYPGFHFRLARVAQRAGIPVLYYIAPKLWAWGERRAARLRETVSHIAAILPFEEHFFHSHGLPVTFVGHPLLDRPPPPTRAEARDAIGGDRTAPVVALMPGSRRVEVERMWPSFLEAARRIKANAPSVRFALGAYGGLRYPGADDIAAAMAPSRTVLAGADVALCKSGTVTLEAALADVPLIITYQTHPITYAIARRIVRLDHIGLVNLLAEHEVAPEFVQGAATPAALASAVCALLANVAGCADRQRDGFVTVRDRLGTPGAARRVKNLLVEIAG